MWANRTNCTGYYKICEQTEQTVDIIKYVSKQNKLSFPYKQCLKTCFFENIWIHLILLKPSNILDWEKRSNGGWREGDKR